MVPVINYMSEETVSNTLSYAICGFVAVLVARARIFVFIMASIDRHDRDKTEITIP